MVVTADGQIVGSSRFEEPDEGRSRILIDHAFTAFDTVELRVGVDNARTRGAVEEFLGARLAGTVATALGEDAVYEVSKEDWQA